MAAVLGSLSLSQVRGLLGRWSEDAHVCWAAMYVCRDVGNSHSTLLGAGAHEALGCGY